MDKYIIYSIILIIIYVAIGVIIVFNNKYNIISFGENKIKNKITVPIPVYNFYSEYQLKELGIDKILNKILFFKDKLLFIDISGEYINKSQYAPGYSIQNYEIINENKCISNYCYNKVLKVYINLDPKLYVIKLIINPNKNEFNTKPFTDSNIYRNDLFLDHNSNFRHNIFNYKPRTFHTAINNIMNSSDTIPQKNNKIKKYLESTDFNAYIINDKIFFGNKGYSPFKLKYNKNSIENNNYVSDILTKNNIKISDLKSFETFYK
tara:strand:- start:54 stop:845 length:792 start_codon:yes stop_codon:yes gene_type:complete